MSLKNDFPGDARTLVGTHPSIPPAPTERERPQSVLLTEKSRQQPTPLPK